MVYPRLEPQSQVLLPGVDMAALPLPGWFPQAVSLGPLVRQWTIETLTPQRALDLKRRVHPGNRKLSEPRVRALRASMERGEWRATGQPFARLDALNYIVDGGHTVTALAGSKCAGIPNVTIVQILDPEAIAYIDVLGKKRTAFDILKMEGRGTIERSLIAAIAIEALNFSYDHNRGKRNALEDARHVQAYPFSDALRRVYQASRSRMLVQSGFLAAVARCLRMSSDAEQFYTAVVQNDLTMGTDAIVSQVQALTNSLMSTATRRRESAMVGSGGYKAQIVAAAVAIKAWNAWRSDRPLQPTKSLRFLLGTEAFPEALP
jgi:hypothetical protein